MKNFTTLFLIACIGSVSAFGIHTSLQTSTRAAAARNGSTGMVMRARVCDLLGKRHNRQARQISFSHTRTKKVQEINLQTKRFFSEELGRTVTLRLSTKGLKTVDKYGGVDAAAKKFGLDLSTF